MKSNRNIKNNLPNLYKLKFTDFRLWNLITLVVCMLSLAACSDNLDFSSGIESKLPDGYIRLNLAVPDPLVVNTRAVDESGINNLEIFIFDEDETGFLQHQTITNVSGTSVGLSLANNVRNKTVIIYAVANVPAEQIKDITSVDPLKKYNLQDDLKEVEYLPMIGRGKVNTADESTSTISLYRSVAKITAECDPKTEATFKELRVYNYSSTGDLGAPLSTSQNYYNKEAITTKSDGQGTGIAFVYPSMGFGQKDSSGKRDMNNGAFVVVGVDRKNETQYYRLNLRKEDDKGELDYLNLDPNYYYQIKITGFMTDGYTSPEEASRHPECDQFVVYEIHDHALEVLSMVTDGYRELGVSPEVVLSNKEEGRQGILTVKCFDPDELVDASAITIKILDSSNQITIGDPEDHQKHNVSYNTEGESNDRIIEDDPSPSYDKDNHGQQYDYLITINDGVNIYEDQTWDILVTWKGLTRKVKVSYEAAFLLPEVCDVTLTMYGSSGNRLGEISDYWKFVTGKGEGVDQYGESPKLFGIHSDEMTNAKKRSNGFHFPMPYGEKKENEILVVDPWEYVYEVDFTKLSERTDVNKNIKDIQCSFSSSTDAFLKQNIVPSRNGNKITLKMDSGNKSYDYAGGNIIFTVNFDDDSTTDITASLYHTGFFHYEGNNMYVPEDRKGYYYYEVVPMGDGYWLDRNICASSNKSFIDISEENIDKSAAGLYYTIINKPRDFQLPEWDFGMCPPGYHVPNQTEWDALRFAPNFTTSNVTYNNTVYMSTYYVTGNSKIGNVYFQKTRFVNSNNIYNETTRYSEDRNSGDAGAGYYWSVTEAPAMEKEQMGNWLRALYLNGSASSYTNASVTDHRMPVRCKAGTKDDVTPPQEYYISLNVHEATHVFLFDVSSSIPTPIFTFPGRAVGTTASAMKWQHFYCSTTSSPDHLRVLFVKLLEDGKVAIYTRSGDSFETNLSYNPSFLTEDYSWPVTNGAYYDFCKTGEGRDTNVFTSLAGLANDGYYPTDCITDDGSSGGGGDGPMIDGDFEWSGYFGGGWSNGWDGLSTNYDWSKVNSCTLTITVEAWWDDCVIRLCHKDPSWEKLNGVREALRGNTDEINYSMLGYPGYKEGERREASYTIEFNNDMLEDLKTHGGLIITGNNFQLNKVVLKIN